MSVNNGDVIQVAGQAAIYFVENGRRRLVPNMETFWAREFVPSLVKFISPQEMNGIPLGDPLEPARRFEVAVKDFLGSGHYMESNGAFSTYTGNLRIDTVTYTITALGGYHGGVVVMGFDQSPQRVSLFATQPRIYGVDGTWIGKSRVEAEWEEQIDPAKARAVGEVRVVHSWYPQNLQVTIKKAVDTLMPVVDLAKAIQSVAKLSAPAPVKS
jgi:hypothetical protein